MSQEQPIELEKYAEQQGFAYSNFTSDENFVEDKEQTKENTTLMNLDREAGQLNFGEKDLSIIKDMMGLKKFEDDLKYRTSFVNAFLLPVKIFPYAIIVIIVALIFLRIFYTNNEIIDNDHKLIERSVISEDLIKAFLLALSVNYLGIFIIITKDLFPQGKDSTKEKTDTLSDKKIPQSGNQKT